MFCIKLGKKEQYKNAYRITALLQLTLSFLLLVQFIINPPTPIEAQEQPEVTVTRREEREGEQELLVTASPTLEIEPTERLTGTQEVVVSTPVATEEAAESREGSDFLSILLIVVIGLLILGLVLILLRWQFKKAAKVAGERVAKRVKAKANANFAQTSAPVEWNLDLEPPIPLPATWLQSPKGAPYLQSLDPSTGSIYFALTQPVSRVGRGEENELRIDESFMGWQTVSRSHAKIERDGKEFILIDTRSSNGTQVNGRYSNINLLQNDCIISFGRVKFAFRHQATTWHQPKT